MCNISELTDELRKTVNYVMYIKFYCDRSDIQDSEGISDEDVLKYLYLATENIYSIIWEITKYDKKSISNEKSEELLRHFMDSSILSDKCIEKIMYIDLCYTDYLLNGVESCFYCIETLRKLTEYYDDVLDELYEYLDY